VPGSTPFVDNDLLSSLGETLLVFEHLFDTRIRGVSRMVARSKAGLPAHPSWALYVFGNRLLRFPRSWKPNPTLRSQSKHPPVRLPGTFGITETVSKNVMHGHGGWRDRKPAILLTRLVQLFLQTNRRKWWLAVIKTKMSVTTTALAEGVCRNRGDGSNCLQE